MACRIGVTTDPESRRARWEQWCLRQGHPMKNWEIVGEFSIQEEAEEAGNDLAAKLGGEASPGAPDMDGPWHLYKVEY